MALCEAHIAGSRLATQAAKPRAMNGPRLESGEWNLRLFWRFDQPAPLDDPTRVTSAESLFPTGDFDVQSQNGVATEQAVFVFEVLDALLTLSDRAKLEWKFTGVLNLELSGGKIGLEREKTKVSLTVWDSVDSEHKTLSGDWESFSTSVHDLLEEFLENMRQQYPNATETPLYQNLAARL